MFEAPLLGPELPPQNAGRPPRLLPGAPGLLEAADQRADRRLLRGPGPLTASGDSERPLRCLRGTAADARGNGNGGDGDDDHDSL